jgi:histidine decarboxylase
MDSKTLKDSAQYSLGYPCTLSYDYSAMSPFSTVTINNVGCPYSSSTFKANTKDIEMEVLAWFSSLWGVSYEDIWGYITNGSTESNLQGLYVAREVAFNSSKYSDHIFLTSADSHYSLFKIAKMLMLNLVVVKTQNNGEIDYNDFTKQLIFNLDKFIIINANLGTTMKGAMDNTRELYSILKTYDKHYDDEFYMHLDGALTGFYLPFIERDLFFKAHVHSISISGHKFPGIPFPCGVFMMEKRFLSFISNDIEYIGSVDATISGSRNGHSALYFKHIIDMKGFNGFKNDVERCLDMAQYLEQRIPEAWRNQNSITVVIPRASPEIIDKWQLATQDNLSHVICMPHVTKDKLDLFIKEYNGVKNN